VSTCLSESVITESAPWRNAVPTAYQLQKTMLKTGKLLFTYALVFCFKLQTF